MTKFKVKRGEYLVGYHWTDGSGKQAIGHFTSEVNTPCSTGEYMDSIIDHLAESFGFKKSEVVITAITRIAY